MINEREMKKTFDIFLDATGWCWGEDNSIQKQLDQCRAMEPYQLGLKPHAVRIKGTARDGSIVRVDISKFKRQPAGFHVETGKMVPSMYDPKGIAETVWTTVEYDEPTIHRNTLRDEVQEQVAGYLKVCKYSYKSDANPLRFVLDDGTDVTDKIGRQALFELLLDYDGPTDWQFKTKSKAEREAEILDVPAFIDRFGQECKVGDQVIFTDKEYSKDALIGAGINFGKIIRYLPKGGVVIRNIQGDERKIIYLFDTIMVKLDKDLMERVMLGKLGQDLVDAD